jgi:hypothetical protein
MERINLKITEFNTQYDEHDWWAKAPEMDKLFAEIVKLPETQQLVNCIEAIKQYLFPTLEVSYY